MTGYSGYSLLDIDRDTRTELAVIRLDPAGVDSTVEVYGWQNGMLDRLGTARLSAGITALASNGVRINYLTGVIPALYITSTLTDGGQATDIVAMRDGSLVNLTMNQETGVSVETIRGYGDIRPMDVNSDTILEMPRPTCCPPTGRTCPATSGSSTGASTTWGRAAPVFTTYHNMSDQWYLIIPEEWVDQITISRSDSSGIRAVIFSLWNGQKKAPTRFWPSTS